MNQNCELYLARRGALIVVASIEFRLVFSAANKCPYENSFHPFRNLVWDSSDGQSWNFTSHFSPPLVPTYLSVETTRTGRVLSWIIRKKERKKKKRKQEKYRLLRRFYYHRFYYRPWSISRARTGPPTGVFNAARDSAGLLLSRITWNLWDPTRGDDFIIRGLYSVREIFVVSEGCRVIHVEKKI